MVREARFGQPIKEYLQGIDATLTPFSGKYIVHGGPYVPLEGRWSGELIVIEFPSMELAQGWYDSDAYRAIRQLRIDNTEGDVLLVHGAKDGHKGADLLG